MQALRLILSSSILLACAILVGCSDAPNTVNLDYHQRLQTQLELADLTPYSDRHKLIIPELKSAESSTISLIQLARLQHCQIGQLIAEHNSQLGKLASPSGEFSYQVQFLQLLPKCLSNLDDDTLTEELKKVYNEKHANLFLYWQLLVFNDKQLASLYLPFSHSLFEVNEESKQATFNSLQYLADSKHAVISDNVDTIQVTALEQQLSGLFKNAYLPSLLRALYEQLHLLQQQTELLKTVSFDSLCKKGHNNQKAVILSNIFSKFYGSKIQQYHNLLLREYSYVAPSLKTLWQDKQGQPYPSELAVHPLKLDEALKMASVNHVSWWQTLYKQCAIQPGG